MSHRPFHTPSRREFLKLTVALSAGGLAAQHMSPSGRPNRATAADAQEGIIDAHSHIWTRDVARYPLAAGQTVDDLKPPSFTTDELLETARPHGVTRVVLIQHKPYHGLDNSYIADTIAKHPGTFSGVACIDAEAAEPQREITRLKNLGFRGFRIRPGEGGKDRWIDSPGMGAIWDYAGKEGLAICPLIDPEHIRQVDEMCQAFARTNVVVDHFARIGVDGTIRDADLDALVNLARHEHAHVKISAYYALGQKKPPYTDLIPMIRRLSQAFGPHRLMWGSDSPYQLAAPNTYGDSLALVRDKINFWTADERDWVLRKTAEAVYFS
jgi:predicted TIM-barrel fold metal-dependent hydrolase